ncbi:Flp family type IVb pilin [Hyphomonas sp.]|uniref:Flp family type IVb pilin n=1 Tax=Hyphomonas sp. TaxID=87 RepID=UPI002620790D|nr:Flp family type IVb pilin [Hyphomonas sp.]
MMGLFRKRMKRLARDERGATAIEYGLIAALMVVGILGSLSAFASANDDMYQYVEDNLVQV